MEKTEQTPLGKMDTTLLEIYETLFSFYGDLQWWPAKTPYEVMVGAILTQNTAWTNVEKAIGRFEGDLSPERIDHLSLEELQDLIRPAGFYKQKSKYLKALTAWFLAYDCDVKRIQNLRLSDVRKELLGVHGVGNETADSILLYAFHFPTFVVDAYTMRLFKRYPLDAGRTYAQVKKFIERRIPADVLMYNRFHALLVQNGKDHCRKKARCEGCALESSCKKCFD
ncbi:MAG: endonuclease III domain-containing protein [Saccharofermentanales bacterium]